MPLKYLSISWTSLEIPLINCKVESKLKWTKHCVLSVLRNENSNANSNINFSITDTI